MFDYAGDIMEKAIKIFLISMKMFARDGNISLKK